MPIHPKSKKIYDSFIMLNPSGDFMCHIDEKRANWYIEKDLAVWEDKKQKKFRLKFEPKGHGNSKLDYYNQKLKNCCVVCGDDNEKNLNKHHVVPYVFRKRFPKEYKDSNHHDVLVTCIECHDGYERHATQLKKRLANEVGEVLGGRPLSDKEFYNKKIITSRIVLKNFKSGSLVASKGRKVVLPEKRVAELQEWASKELLVIEKTNNVLWADLIVEKHLNEGTLFDFIKMWRQHFIDYAKPRFLPELWDVEFPIQTGDIVRKNSVCS